MKMEYPSSNSDLGSCAKRQTGGRQMGEPRPVLIDGALLAEAEALGLEVRSLVEEELRRLIEKRRTADNWAEQNRGFVESYNRHIDRHGPTGDEYRRYG